MSNFNDVFNKVSIFDTLFFNIKAVLEYPTLKSLKESNVSMYNHWMSLSNKKYVGDDEETKYQEYAVYFPEFSKIVSITYASLYLKNGDIKRDFKKIMDVDERVVIETFYNFLSKISSEGIQSTPQTLPILCGHNILGYDIPFLIKRFVKILPQLQTTTLPFILKRTLDLKPWESGVLDTSVIWKFNGYNGASLHMISDFLGLKNNVEILSTPKISKYYHDNIGTDVNETLKFITLQSAVQTNLTIQLVNRLRML